MKAVVIVGDLGDSLRWTIQRVVVEIPIAISPPPIAAASPATPVGIRAPERPETVVKMVRVEAAVVVAHRCRPRRARRPSRLLCERR